MPRITSQQDLVRQYVQEHDEFDVTEKLRIPGIEELHRRPFDEQAEVLANVLKCRTNVSEIRWVIGKYIEVSWSKVK